MATQTFGTQVDPSHFTEMADPDNPGQVIRPPSGTVLLVQDASTGQALGASIVTGLYGHWSYTTDSVPEILVSPDGGSTWVGPLRSKEALSAAVQTSSIAQQALTIAGNASQVAQQALQQASSSSVKFVDNKTTPATNILGPAFTLAGIHARDIRDPIDASEIDGPSGTLAPIATSGASADLADANAPGGALLLTQGADGTAQIPAIFLANVNSSGHFVFQNADGSWDPRTAHSTDPTEQLQLIPRDVTKPKPPLGTDGVAYYEPNPALGLPGDVLWNLGYTT